MSQAESYRDVDPYDLRGVEFVETTIVKDGVECDVYKFVDDESKDLAVVRVKGGFKTPLQRVVKGVKTVEGYIDGRGTLTIMDPDGQATIYNFPSGERSEVTVEVGQTMQWHAQDETNLTFYEVCSPPYQDGRFENLPE